MYNQQIGISSRSARGLLRTKAFGILLSITLLAIAIWQIGAFTERKSLERLSHTGNLRVHLYAASLRDTLEKYRHLPYVLARDSRVISLLDNDIPSLRVNPHLEDFAHATGALLYVLDRGGTTVATSNWRTKSSLLGHNYSFRPYFTDAQSGKNGGYYGVGLRTHLPGFYLSYPVKRNGEFMGAIVVKVDLEPMQEAWKKSGEAVIVSDASGVIFLTSKNEWKYKALRKLPDRTVRRLQAMQYLDATLPALAMKRQSQRGYNIIKLDKTRYLEQALQLPEYGWRIHYLTNLKAVENSTQIAIILATVIASLIILAQLYLQERKEKIFSLQEAGKAKAVREVNERLLLEIAKHKGTEKDLRNIQKELIQAGKLAALGRMSAAIAHELNQPVSAIRTFLASCRILLERNQTDKVQENLDFIAKLIDRMAKITGQLKTFASKSRAQRQTVDLVQVIERVVQFTRPQLESKDISLTVHIAHKSKAMVKGDSLQLEQVMSNLIHNAQDAVKQSPSKDIRLTLTTTQTRVVVALADSGPGIAQEAVDFLFDPFFTTKDIGEGLGLGLSISYGIVQDMDGMISALNLKEGGAQFTIDLPLTQE